MRDKKKLTKYAIIIGSVILVFIIALVVCLNPPIQKLKNDNSGSIPTKVENENQENSNTTLDNNDMVDTTNKNSTGTSKDLSKTDTNSSKDNNVSSNNDNTKNEDTEKNNKVSTNDTTTKNNDDKTSSSKEQNQNSVTHNDNKSENSNENTSNDTSKNNESNNSKTENNSESNDSSTKEEPTPSVDKELENLKKTYRYETSAICYEESINVAFLYADNENFKHTACKSGAYKGQLIGYALLIYYKDGTTEYYMGN